jgi:hypothetical protein
MLQKSEIEQPQNLAEVDLWAASVGRPTTVLMRITHSTLDIARGPTGPIWNPAEAAAGVCTDQRAGNHPEKVRIVREARNAAANAHFTRFPIP